MMGIHFLKKKKFIYSHNSKHSKLRDYRFWWYTHTGFAVFQEWVIKNKFLFKHPGNKLLNASQYHGALTISAYLRVRENIWDQTFFWRGGDRLSSKYENFNVLAHISSLSMFFFNFMKKFDIHSFVNTNIKQNKKVKESGSGLNLKDSVWNPMFTD